MRNAHLGCDDEKKRDTSVIVDSIALLIIYIQDLLSGLMIVLLALGFKSVYSNILYRIILKNQ